MKFVQFNRKKFVLAILMAGMFSLLLLGLFLVGIFLTSPIRPLEFLAVIFACLLLVISVLLSCQSGNWIDDGTKEGSGTRLLVVGFDPEAVGGMKSAVRGKKSLVIFWIFLAALAAFLTGLAVGEVSDARLQYPLVFLLALLYQGLGFVTEYLGRDRGDDEPTKAGAFVFTLFVVVLLVGDTAGFLLPFGIFLFKQGTPGATLTLWNPFMIGFWFALSWLVSRFATWAYYNLNLTQSSETK